MTTKTITATYPAGYTLSAAYTTITPTGVVENTDATGSALVGPTGTNWTLVNAGLVSDTAFSLAYGHFGGGITFAQSRTITNAAGGTIAAASTGIALAGGGYLTNTGTISSLYRYAVYAGGTNVTVLNAGHISGGEGGVRLKSASGIFDNRAGATLLGAPADYFAVYAGSAGLTVTNDGEIGGGIGVFLSGSQLTDQSAGTIAASVYNGVLAKAGATIVNAGVISAVQHGVMLYGNSVLTNQSGGRISGGVGYDAVTFVSGNNRRLVVAPGARFVGTVDGGATASSTLEMEVGASAGALTGLGTQFVNFGQVTIDSGAAWTLSGSNDLAGGVTLTNAGTLTVQGGTLSGTGALVNNSGVTLNSANATFTSVGGAGNDILGASSRLEALGSVAGGQTLAFGGANTLLKLDAPALIAGTITGFGTGNTIDLAGVSRRSVSYNAGKLDFTISGTQYSIAMPMGGTGSILTATDNAGGTDVTTLCFCAGTRIATPRGEMPVEALAVGDLVVTASGAMRPIAWIGIGQVLATRGMRGPATPVVVRKGALAQNVPNSDLRLTKRHALFVDGVLIPVEFLVNHRTIHWDDRAREVSLFHIELETHDVLMANGAPAESFRDDGNRWLFRNARTGENLPTQEPCAPVLTGGPIVDGVWRRLLERAGRRPGLPVTDAPDLHLAVDSVRVDPAARANQIYGFRLLRVPREIRIVSRSGVPAELGLARDPRNLGVALRTILLSQGRKLVAVSVDAPALRDGFHEYESDNAIRWTNGDARLPAALWDGFGDAMTLELRLGGATQYPLLGADRRLVA